MRVLGIDYGDVHVGIAVSDELLMLARGLTTIRRDAKRAKWYFLPQVKRIVDEYGVNTIVLGYPVNKNTTISPQALKTLEFLKALRRECPGTDVVLYDERLTTAQAGRILQEKNIPRGRRNKVIDELAAEIILQDYLDERRRRESAEHDTSMTL